MAEETIINGQVNELSGEDFFDTNQHTVDKVTELTTTIGDIENENQKLALENREMKEKAAKLTAEIEQLRETESKTKRRLVEMEREVDKSDEERMVLEAVAAKAADLETEVARLQHDLINAMNKGDEATAEVKNLQKEISDKGVQLDGLEKEIQALRIVKEENDEKVWELEAKLGDLEVRDLDEGNKKVKVEEETCENIDQKEKEIAGLKKIVESLESEVGETKGELENSKTEKTGVEKMLIASETKVASMAMKMVELKKQLEEADKVIQGLKDTVVEPVNGSVAGGSNLSLWLVVAAGSAGAVVVTVAALCVLHARRK